MKKRTVTKATGKMDCLTVSAEAPVKPLLATLFVRLVALATASALEGCRWARTSSRVGSIAMGGLNGRSDVDEETEEEFEMSLEIGV